jgi:hypothetical protein
MVGKMIKIIQRPHFEKEQTEIRKLGTRSDLPLFIFTYLTKLNINKVSVPNAYQHII